MLLLFWFTVLFLQGADHVADRQGGQIVKQRVARLDVLGKFRVSIQQTGDFVPRNLPLEISVGEEQPHDTLGQRRHVIPEHTTLREQFRKQLAFAPRLGDQPGGFHHLGRDVGLGKNQPLRDFTLHPGHGGRRV